MARSERLLLCEQAKSEKPLAATRCEKLTDFPSGHRGRNRASSRHSEQDMESKQEKGERGSEEQHGCVREDEASVRMVQDRQDWLLPGYCHVSYRAEELHNTEHL